MLEYMLPKMDPNNWVFKSLAALFIRNCALKTTLSTSSADYIAIIQNQNPNYVNTGEGDYHLLSTSPCIGAGKATSVTDDLDGELRDSNPDIGCYEYKP